MSLNTQTIPNLFPAESLKIRLGLLHESGAHREGACNYVYGEIAAFFSHKRIVLLNIVTVDTKHSRKSAMFEFCRLRWQYTELHAPSPAR